MVILLGLRLFDPDENYIWQENITTSEIQNNHQRYKRMKRSTTSIWL